MLDFFLKEIRCSNDSDCDTSQCEYCFSTGFCGQYDDKNEYCDSFQCGVGDGDCDPGECPSGLICGRNNFLEYHSLPSSCARGKLEQMEVCIGTIKQGNVCKSFY